MTVGYSSNIVTDELALCLDIANSKSFVGEPTTNLNTAQTLTGMSGITLAYLGIEDGWKKYSMSGTFTGGTYPYIMFISSVTFTGGVAYSSRCTIKTNVLYKFNYFGTIGINYVNEPMNNNGTGTSVINSDGSRTVSRENFIYTNTTTQDGYLNTNPINNTTFNPATDFVWVKDIQTEQKAYSTPYVNGTRGTTVATGGGWADLTTNSNNGQFVNNPRYDSSNKGSLIFTGANVTYASIANSSSLNFGANQNFTISMWLKTTDAPGSRKPLANKNIDTTDLGWGFYQTSGSLFTKIANGTSVLCEVAISSTVNDGIWQNLVFSFNRSTNLSMYKNGIAAGSTSISSWATTNISNSNPLYIGTHTGLDSGGSWNGNMAQVAIYRKALSQAEALQNFNALRGRFGV